MSENKKGYIVRDQWEANDIAAEAEALSERGEGGNCLLTFVGLILVTAGLLWGTGVALAQVHDVMPVLERDTVYLPQITKGNTRYVTGNSGWGGYHDLHGCDLPD